MLDADDPRLGGDTPHPGSARQRCTDDTRELPSTCSEIALALLLVTGYAGTLIAAAAAALVMLLSTLGALSALLAIALGLAAWFSLVLRVRASIRDHGPRAFRIAADILVLALLPAWGLVYAYGVTEAACVQASCDPAGPYRPFAAPEIHGLIALHALVVLAYAVSRRRPEALRPRAEVIVLGSLVSGIVVHTTIAVHLGAWLAAGIAFPPLFFPCLTPALTVGIFAAELRARLRRRGHEAAVARVRQDGPQIPYRQSALTRAVEVPPRVHRGLLLRAILASPVLLGLSAVLHAVWLGRPAAALQVFTRTCGYTLSQVPIEIVPGDCHYLCTVAARGHPWLVGPERLGRRRGVGIVVNRQLAVANAFEDLLHERWPRFGRLARRIYDRLGLPVSKYIRSPWLADLVYMAMKPSEIVFAIALLLLDRDRPEARIDRMYR